MICLKNWGIGSSGTVTSFANAGRARRAGAKEQGIADDPLSGFTQTTNDPDGFPVCDPDSISFVAGWNNEKAQRRLCPLKRRALNTFGAFYTIRVQESMIF